MMPTPFVLFGSSGPYRSRRSRYRIGPPHLPTAFVSGRLESGRVHRRAALARPWPRGSAIAIINRWDKGDRPHRTSCGPISSLNSLVRRQSASCVKSREFGGFFSSASRRISSSLRGLDRVKRRPCVYLSGRPAHKRLRVPTRDPAGNENAPTADTMPLSKADLIQQLSSAAGSNFTPAQARYAVSKVY